MNISLKKRVALPAPQGLSASPIPSKDGPVGETTLPNDKLTGPDGQRILRALGSIESVSTHPDSPSEFML